MIKPISIKAPRSLCLNTIAVNSKRWGSLDGLKIVSNESDTTTEFYFTNLRSGADYRDARFALKELKALVEK